MDYRRSAVQRVALAMLLAAGCADARAPAPGQDPRITYFQQESQKIDHSETQCISEASALTDDKTTSRAASFSASNNDQRQQVARERNESLERCRTNAARQRQELSERERKAYQDDLREQREHESLMMRLISGPR